MLEIAGATDGEWWIIPCMYEELMKNVKVKKATEKQTYFIVTTYLK